MAHDNCLAKCPSNCDCIKDDIAELKRIKKISIKKIFNLIVKYRAYMDDYILADDDRLSDIVKEIKDLIGE